ncbi:sn-glycerol-3-phosphate ABC transporter ATP-binding protein UgpC [Devosia sp.]|uniref:ABC transporter ATP-binding protein n=1 Tax=Devosia sp. TaxID=1871048 RepID=UPI003267DF62
MASIELANVSKRFGPVQVIDNLSLTVNSNEFMVFLGPSGCGKSTLLRMIAGLESIDDGEIRIDGQRVDHLPPGERGIAMVFQHYALYPHMTVRDNMSFGLRNIGVAPEEITKRVNRAAEMLEISQLLDRKPGQMSGGQRQRVAIGRAIVKEPKAFLFDEPLSNLDAALRVRTRVELAQLHNRVLSTMIFVTHDQIEAMTLAHRIVVMNNRKIEQVGSPMEIYSRPATRFVAEFVGSPAMNFVPVTVGQGASGASVTLADGMVVQTTVPSQALEIGATYDLGIRAEALQVVPAGTGDVSGKAEVIERLGDRTLVYVRLSTGALVVGEAEGDSKVVTGDAVSVKFDGSRTHLFDARGQAYHGL